MKDLIMFIKRFALKYIKGFSLSIFFNIITTLFTIFSFAFLIPILQILFGIEESKVYHYMEIGSAPINDVAVNNFYYFTDQLIANHGQSYTLAVLSLILIGMTALKTGTYYLSDFFLTPLRNGITRDIRNEMFSKIVTLPIGFFTNERKGDIIARISGDVSEVENSVNTSIMSLIRYPIMILGYLIVMIYVSWKLTLFVLIVLPIFGFLMGNIGRKLKAGSLKAQNMWGAILSTTEETIGGLRIVKAFNAEKHMKNRFEGETKELFRLASLPSRRLAPAHLVSETIGTIAVAMVLWFGGSLILSGNSTIDAAQFIYYLVIFYSLINPAKELSRGLYTIQKGLAALERIDKILKADNPIKDPANPTPLPEGEARGTIGINNVSFSYDGKKDVLKDVSISVPAGKTVAIVGKSGSGKSTLVDLIPRFWDLQKGSITVGGKDIRNYKVHDLRSLMGNVNQEAILFNDTIFNNIAFGSPDAKMEDVIRAAKIANAHDFIMETEKGYETRVGDRGSRLSGGQRQRISIARAILKNPPILILDEATSALDTESERLVQEALERLMKNRTTIVIAHRLSTITNADKICVMEDGKIIETGTHAELLEKDGQYKHLVNLQSTQP